MYARAYPDCFGGGGGVNGGVEGDCELQKIGGVGLPPQTHQCKLITHL